MSIQEFGALGEAIGAFLILITLIYLAVQNKQQQKLLLSSVYQARTELAIKQYEILINNPVVSVVLRKSMAGENLSIDERSLVSDYTHLVWRAAENIHFQYTLGVLPDDHITGMHRALSNLLNYPSIREQWLQVRGIYRDAFADWMNQIIQEIEKEERAA